MSLCVLQICVHVRLRTRIEDTRRHLWRKGEEMNQADYRSGRDRRG